MLSYKTGCDSHAMKMTVNFITPSTSTSTLQLGFNDVLAEPDTAQGFDAVWKLAYVVFTQTKLWLYRLVGAAVAVPAAIFSGVVFR